ncbi:MAG: NAD(P)/FAD-dependent oxidoreductase, partial [Acidimicrobiia bacterium]
GFPDGVMGPDLMEQMRKQAERFGTRIISSNVTSVDFSERPFTVSVGADDYQAETIIISTGASARWLGIEGEERLRGFGVSACATCDGFFFRDKELVVVGGGDTAMEEAIFLTKFASKVTVVHRRDEFRASTIMSNRVLDHPKIEVVWDSTVEEITGDSVVTGVTLKNLKTDEVTKLDTDGVFVAIGHTPNTSVFDGVLDLDDAGYILTTPGTTKTSIEGVFAAGDVTDKIYRQAVTAAGMGCQAALDAERLLDAEE